jgi:hypothetical protein
MAITVYIDGICVYSDLFSYRSNSFELGNNVVATLSAHEQQGVNVIREVSCEYEVLHGVRPGCITCYEGVAIAWHTDPHYRSF